MLYKTSGLCSNGLSKSPWHGVGMGSQVTMMHDWRRRRRQRRPKNDTIRRQSWCVKGPCEWQWFLAESNPSRRNWPPRTEATDSPVMIFPPTMAMVKLWMLNQMRMDWRCTKTSLWVVEKRDERRTQEHVSGRGEWGFTVCIWRVKRWKTLNGSRLEVA